MSNRPFDTSKRTTFTQGPNPVFQWGTRVGSTELGRQWLEGEKQGWTGIDTGTDTEDPMKMCKLMLSGITPRPIAFVASRDEHGLDNFAPYSWSNMVSANPPLIAFSPNREAGKERDTAVNIKKTRSKGQQGFTVNIISEPFLEQASSCAVDSPPGVSEWELSGLTKGETKWSMCLGCRRACSAWNALFIKRSKSSTQSPRSTPRLTSSHTSKISTSATTRGLAHLPPPSRPVRGQSEAELSTLRSTGLSGARAISRSRARVMLSEYRGRCGQRRRRR